MKAARQPRRLAHEASRVTRGYIRQRDGNKDFMNVKHYVTCFRARNIALDRASGLHGFELSTADSSPPVNMSRGTDREVSIAK